MHSTRSIPVDVVIKAAGGPSALSRMIGVSPQAISQWRNIPPIRVRDVERATGISRHLLRPDIYGPPPKEEGAA